MESNDKISIGDYIIVQRQKYTKLHKFASADSSVLLGRDLIELQNIHGQPYSTTFKMVVTDAPKKGKRIYSLEPCKNSEPTANILQINRTGGSGSDNRHIIDNGQSQALSSLEIAKLRDECTSSSDIVTQIVENSKTFASKTEYSQEKYLKKKEKKYYEFIQINRTNLRRICDVMQRQCPEKIMGLRMDSLSQLLAYSGVCGIGKFLVYESGTNGLIPAALLNAIGANTDAQLVHMHPGNYPQKHAVLALNLPSEQLDRCISVNIYSVLRHYHQQYGHTMSGSGKKRKIDDDDNGDDFVNITDDPPAKIPKNMPENSNENVDNKEENLPSIATSSDDIPTDHKTPPKQLAVKHQWMQLNEQACQVLSNSVDGLIIVSKEHPKNILMNLLQFVSPGRPIVLFSLTKEILMELYMELKASSNVTNLRLTSSWLRLYQILPNRTHPDVTMSGNSGYLLCGYTVQL